MTKRFGAIVALDRCDLAIDRGAIHGLVGENGAGKSTLGKIVAGVHRADEGELWSTDAARATRRRATRSRTASR